MADDKERGGIRPPNYIYEMAISRVEDLMVQAVSWRRIVAILSDEGYTESEDTAKNWRAEVNRRWTAEDAVLRPARKDQWRARLEHLYSDLLMRAGMSTGGAQALLFSEVIKVAKLSIVLDGVHSPTVIRHEGNAVPVEAMSPLEREREIAELLAKREAARAAAGQGN